MDKKYSSIHYNDYLQLNKILDAQKLRSEEFGETAHDEMLFIIIHQVYELWFKEITHDLTSVMKMFDKETVDEADIGIAIARINRITEIQKILIDQIRVLETMTSLDFLDFRNYLLPASGFQSYQFRVVEVALGLKRKERIAYTQNVYYKVFTEEQQAYLKELENGNSFFDLIERWLERMPFLEQEDFSFLPAYKDAVKKMIHEEQKAISEASYISAQEKELRFKMLGDTDSYFQSVFNQNKHDERIKNGEAKLSYKATISALLINLYRDYPLLRQPYVLLGKIIELDENFTTWRYRHAQMVMGMLGNKIGTGGSSGYDYLSETAKKHRIFSDLNNIATLLIPRSVLPELPSKMKDQLNFHYAVQKK